MFSHLDQKGRAIIRSTAFERVENMKGSEETMMRRALLIGLIVTTAGATAWTQQSRIYDLTLTPEHVHWG